MAADDEQQNVVPTSGTALGRATVRASASSRANWSIQHLLAATRFAREVGVIEAAHTDEPFGEFFEEILWFSSACILSSVAGLEGYVNELFADRAEHFGHFHPGVSEKLWELAEEKPLFERIDIALILKDRPKLDRGKPPAQDVSALIKLRNGLIHFKPEWTDQQDEHEKLSRHLAGLFATSRFLPPNEPFFPRGWASADCARWALTSTVRFLEEFESSAGLPKRIKTFRSRLMP